MLALLTIAQQTGNSAAIALLKESCQPSAEYSAFARVHILPYLAHNFRDPEAIALLKEACQRSPQLGAYARVDCLPELP